MRRILVGVGLLALSVGFFSTQMGSAQVDQRFFPETKHTVKGQFWRYWQEHGALPQQGYPLSEEFTEVSDLNGLSYTVQYFERAVFEKHPENKPPFDVLLSQLGTFQYRAKYGVGGAPNQKASTVNPRRFPETGFTVGGAFLTYWNKNGGLPQQGYPISNEFIEVSDLNGKPYTVQYFERAVFEMHPENKPPFDVLLSQLGTFQYRNKYQGNGTPRIPDPLATIPGAPTLPPAPGTVPVPVPTGQP